LHVSAKPVKDFLVALHETVKGPPLNTSRGRNSAWS
jgi:hypothetical protein